VSVPRPFRRAKFRTPEAGRGGRARRRTQATDARESQLRSGPLTLLVVAPHPDDAELAMGGTMAKMASRGHRIHILDLTDGEPTPFGTPAKRAREAATAARILGVTRSCLGLVNREVVHTLEARHAIAAVIRRERPDLLFAPFPEDAHPDHIAATRLVEDARFDAKLVRSRIEGEPHWTPRLFHYFATHLRIVPAPSFLMDTSGFDALRRRAVLAYRSQFVEPPANRRIVEWLDAAAVYFGSRIGAATAEPFFSRESLGVDDLAAVAARRP